MAQTLNTFSRNTFDRLCEVYDRQVRSFALRSLLDQGFYGLDPREDAPATYEALCQYVGHGAWISPERRYSNGRVRLFPVYDGGCENTVFCDAVGNYLFRAWHDLTHLQLRAHFDYEGEHKVAMHQAAFFGQQGELRDICVADTIGQLNFYHFTGGLFVEHQRDFVFDWLTIGESRAIRKHEELALQAAREREVGKNFSSAV